MAYLSLSRAVSQFGIFSPDIAARARAHLMLI